MDGRVGGGGRARRRLPKEPIEKQNTPLISCASLHFQK